MDWVILPLETLFPLTHEEGLGHPLGPPSFLWILKQRRNGLATRKSCRRRKLRTIRIVLLLTCTFFPKSLASWLGRRRWENLEKVAKRRKLKGKSLEFLMKNEQMSPIHPYINIEKWKHKITKKDESLYPITTCHLSKTSKIYLVYTGFTSKNVRMSRSYEKALWALKETNYENTERSMTILRDG